MKVVDSKTKNTLESENPIVTKSWQDDPKRFKLVEEPKPTSEQRTKKE